jgi:CheY-like chemotaxis protein
MSALGPLPASNPPVPRRLLVVEDDPANIALMRAILRPRGFGLAFAGSLAEARQAMAADRPDLVLLDIRLPDGSGLDLARELRARPELDRLPLIAVSASVLPSDRAAVDAAGCDAFVPKPIRPRELLAEIDRRMEGAADLRAPGGGS